MYMYLYTFELKVSMPEEILKSQRTTYAHIATCCSVYDLERGAIDWLATRVLQYVAMCCLAVCCNVLQCVAACRSVYDLENGAID